MFEALMPLADRQQIQPEATREQPISGLSIV
jgi:hypothetical protein